MPRRAKISAGILLSFGCVGSVASVIRIAYLGGLSVDDHFFRHALDAGLWSVVEPGLGITAASLSALRPLFRSMKDKTVFTRTKQTSNPDQKRITRSNVSYQDQKGFQLFENPDSWTRTMITTGTGRKNLSAINEMQDLEPVLPDTDSQNSQPGPLLERNVSQKSLVDRSTGGWTRVERAGVTVTRRFDISSSENMV
ncbi:hypothetical protein H2203_004839 [Taxawa tesnikishii (nom. ined.)]|nr:hypothetical protein H2203_004839 [Dothideales sp. JES 119]